ncbi:MAG: Hpt domain-containing protein [Planctomycetota bacterium]
MTVQPAPIEPIASSLPTDDAELREIVAMWVDTLTLKTNELRELVESEQLEAVAELAHWLNGSAGTAGYDAFTEVAASLEQAAKAGQSQELGPHVDQIARLGEAVRAGLPKG